MPLSKKSTLFGISYNNLYLWLILAVAVAVVLLVSLPRFFKFSVSQAKEATLILAFENNGQGRMFQGEVVENMTILDALIASSEAGKITFKYEFTSDNDVSILELDGYNSGQKELIFTLNGSKVVSGNIHETYLKSGDKVEVQLE